MSCLLGENRDIFFPKLSPELNLIKFSDIAVRYLRDRGFEPVECSSELEARESVDEMMQGGKWLVYFFSSDTTGEKDFEEFFTADETLDLARFDSIGVIKNELEFDDAKLNRFLEDIRSIRTGQIWNKEQFVEAFHEFFPSFEHLETGKYLDNRM